MVICVPTPLSEDGGPDLSGDRGRPERRRISTAGDAGSLESTTYPGPTDDVVRPILEATGLVAGVDSGHTEKGARFLGKFVQTVV
jgi:UDP-N-acetyl-D-mannosaminuronate dehydrogenase